MRHVEKVAREGLGIQLRVPRLPGPSPRAKHKHMLLFHAEAKGLGLRWHLETTQKHLPVRFLYALALKLIRFSFYGPRKLRGMWACSRNSSSRNVPGTVRGNGSWNRHVPELGQGTEALPDVERQLWRSTRGDRQKKYSFTYVV